MKNYLLPFLLLLSPFTHAQDKISRSFFEPYETVMDRLHSDVEAETDLVYLVNTADKSTRCLGHMPMQHMMLLKRSKGASIFTRDQRGDITGIHPQTLRAAVSRDYKVAPVFKLPEQLNGDSFLIPISSGTPGGKKILTYSGIFRVNERRTNDMRKSTNTDQDPMQYSVYINGEYDEGNEARLALHGTATRFWPLLGKQRASSGCIRLQSDFSRWNQELLFSKADDGQLIPRSEYTGDIKNWNRRDPFPPAEGNFSTLKTSRKLKVLIIFFDGYQQSC